jgi:hypothetical protein
MRIRNDDSNAGEVRRPILLQSGFRKLIFLAHLNQKPAEDRSRRTARIEHRVGLVEPLPAIAHPHCGAILWPLPLPTQSVHPGVLKDILGVKEASLEPIVESLAEPLEPENNAIITINRM